jgi:uncharacterized protein (DUF305 family)
MTTEPPMRFTVNNTHPQPDSESETFTVNKQYLRRALLALAAGVAVAALATACGGGSDMSGMDHSSSPSANTTARHNSADVMFAQMMIPHHQQAIEMADLAPSRASNAEIKKLATQIKNAQGPEIQTMTSWLKSWGEPTAASGGMSMGEGMMSDADMAKLKAAKGMDFDMMFAQMMIAHHNGAISMARDEIKNGQNTEAKKLARQIISTQSAEIKILRKYANM